MTSLIRLRCPQCGSQDHLDINANIWVRLTDDGTDADLAASRDHEWNDASHIRCVSCGCSGKVGEFQPNEYMAYFRTSAGPAEDIFVANTPEQALELARKAFSEDPGKFGFSPADCGYLKLQEIRIVNEHAKELLDWTTDEYRLQLAAPQLLKALEAQVQATREIIDAWNNTDQLYGAVQDLISDLDHQSQLAQAVLEAHETSDLGSTIDELEQSLNTSLEAVAQAKGGAA
jgi:hypothetical protein